ncbi:MAG: hypothetical protein ACKO5M_07355 [Vulcanococcus sp.]
MLTEAELHELESSLLPALERHHLRLLAHSLRCLQQAAAEAGQTTGSATALNDAAALHAWATRQPNLVADPAFIPVLVEQLGKAAVQLEQIGQERAKAALALELGDLVAWGKACADARLSERNAGASATPPPLTPPHS